MVNVTIEGDRAVFQVEGLDRMWAFRSRLEIPLAHIVDVQHDPEQVGRWWHGEDPGAAASQLRRAIRA